MRICLFPLLFLLLAAVVGAARTRTPNVVFILADDLGYGDLGSYGQRTIATPHLDRMAAEGMRFSQFYAGSTVCAPSRSVLMTGQHTGHTTVRGNAGTKGAVAQTLRAEDVTLAEMLQQAGYRTSLVGKWGLGEADSAGAPWRQGFDEFFGFLNQTHAHNHFPDHLWRNNQRVALKNDLVPIGSTGAGYATQRIEYANDLFFAESEAFLERNQAKPFFLFLSLTVPHANNERSRALGDGQEVPDYGRYAKEKWPDAVKGQAAMITRMDDGIGRLLGRLRELGLDEKTLVMFSSDNGPHREGGPDYDPVFFNAGGGLRGIKRDLTEGGIRVPMIARWPGTIPAATVSGHASYLGDLFATFAELAVAQASTATDSISLVPVLKGKASEQKTHEFLYWEFHERTFSQAVIWQGRWKGIRTGGDSLTLKVYDLSTDIAEKTDVAMAQPEIAARLVAAMDASHVPNEHWAFRRAAEKP